MSSPTPWIAVCLLLSGARLSAQCEPSEGPGLAVTSEIAVDDVQPFGDEGPPVEYNQPRVLKVTAADYDADGDLDLAAGGNAAEPNACRIYYLNDGHRWDVEKVESLPHTHTSGMGTSDSYGVITGEFDGDGVPDLLVGRLLDTTDVSRGLTDTVFLNALLDPLHQPFQPLFPIRGARSVPNPTFGTTNLGATFGMAVGDVNNDGDLDLVTSGSNYPVRYFLGGGDGRFNYQRSYVDGDAENCRDVQLGDLNMDGKLDLFVSRVNAGDTNPADDEPNRAWFNRIGQGGFHEGHPFQMAPGSGAGGADFTFPGLEVFSWDGGTCGVPGQSLTNGQTFESAIGDLDNDGWPDVVCSAVGGLSGAWQNNHDETFGCVDSGKAHPDVLFPNVTPSWSGPSECLSNMHDLDPMCGHVFTVPGPLINFVTGVDLADVDRDGFLDVSLSARNDMEEGCLILGYDYFDSDPTNPVPDTYDLLFYNRSEPGILEFDGNAELIHFANDGTGYAEWIPINGDRRPEWVDANFSNDNQGWRNRAYWTKAIFSVEVAGHGIHPGIGKIAPPGAPLDDGGGGDDDGGAGGDLVISVSAPEARAGVPWEVVARPQALAAPLTGRLDEGGEARILVPRRLLPSAGTTWLTVNLLPGGQPVPVGQSVLFTAEDDR